MSDKKLLNNVSKLFTAPQLKTTSLKNRKEVLKKLASKTDTSQSINSSPKNIFDSLYQTLFENYRCEYIYKNEIAKQLFLNQHSLLNANIFSEVDILDSKADVLVINGTSTIYEIKSELDSFDRLSNQLLSYSSVADKIYVVTSPKRVEELNNLIPSHVGIIELCDNKKLNKIKLAQSNKVNILPEVVFSLLHKKEYLEAILDHYGELPNKSVIDMYDECKRLFSNLTPLKAHYYMINFMSKRLKKGKNELFLNNFPQSLKFIGLVAPYTQRDFSLVSNFLS